MKTLREYLDQLDEISRRDFLKGAGAAAVGAAGGYSLAPKQQLGSNTKNLSSEDIKTIDDYLTAYSVSKWMKASPESTVYLHQLYEPGIEKFIKNYGQEGKDLLNARFKVVEKKINSSMSHDDFNKIFNYYYKLGPNGKYRYNDVQIKFLKLLNEFNESVEEGILDKAKNAVGWLQDLKGQVPSRSERSKISQNPTSPVAKKTELSDQFVNWVKLKTGNNSDKFASLVNQIEILMFNQDPKKWNSDWITWDDWLIIFQWIDDAWSFINKKYPDKEWKEVSHFVHTLAGNKLWNALKQRSNQNEQDLEEASPDAVKRIEQLVRYK